MNPAPAFSAADAAPELPTTGFRAMVMSLHEQWRVRRKPLARTGGPAQPPEASPDVEFWEDPAFWLWMIH